jgi:hypothetical protein
MSRRWVSSAIVALAAVATLAGCSPRQYDAASLVGDYVSASTKGEIVLADDGTFTASSVPLWALDNGASAVNVDLSGEWGVENSKYSSSYVRLDIHEITGAELRTDGLQLWVGGGDRGLSFDDEVFFQPDVDEARSVVYKRKE